MAQGGQTLVVFTIVSAFVLLGTIALVGNTQVLFVNADRADATALLAAQAGASAIDIGQLYNNQVVLAPAEAVSRCETAGRQNQARTVVAVSCSVQGNTVTATVIESVDLPIPLWASFETVSATRTARPAFGGSTGQPFGQIDGG